MGGGQGDRQASPSQPIAAAATSLLRQTSSDGAGMTWAGLSLRLEITFSRYLRGRALRPHRCRTHLLHHHLRPRCRPPPPDRAPGLREGSPCASIPSLPHLLCLKLINSCPNAPGRPGSSSWPLLPSVPSRLLGGPRQMLPAGTHTSGPVSCRRPAGHARCQLFPAVQLVQPGAVGAEERVWGRSHQFEAVHPTRSKGRARGSTKGEPRDCSCDAKSLQTTCPDPHEGVRRCGEQQAAGLGRGPGCESTLIQPHSCRNAPAPRVGSQRLPPGPLSSFSSFPSGATHVKPNPPVTWFKGRARE